MLYDMEKQSKGAFEMYCDMEDLAIDLNLLPTTMQLCIESLGLDNTNHTKDECLYIGLRSDTIYDVLTLAQRTIQRFKEDRERLYEEYKKLKPETTETTK